MKNQFRISLLAAVVCLIAVLTAFNFKEEEKTTSFVSMTLPIWKTGKMHTLEVADAMPEEKYTYKPSEVSKTFAEQMVHIGYTLTYFSQAMIKGEEVKYEEPSAEGLSKAEVRAIVEKGYADMEAAIKALKEDDLKVELPFGPDTKMTRAQAIIFANDHCTNHRAKANLYIRMNNIEPPSYKFM